MGKRCDWALVSGDFLIMIFGLKKHMDKVLDLPMVKKNKETRASSSCSTEEAMKGKCSLFPFLATPTENPQYLLVGGYPMLGGARSWACKEDVEKAVVSGWKSNEVHTKKREGEENLCIENSPI